MITTTKVLGIKDVAAMISISRSTIYDWMNPDSPRYDATFPKPIKLNGSSIRWFESELIEWLKSKQH
ncbi:AlpA family phage regulatory protein [uncultured Tolumonas sp.]|uniref:helix-turn-helix transcriptional regulator n=1 Tax=uncultured Tolumonas sp. TaxID=263765 RepID=UPI0029309C2A|nr:AlpA family phage regulatory protein [uncultured Tolumonas sp.]